MEGVSPERWEQIEALYHAALERTQADRARLLAQADPDLRHEVESLLDQPSGAALLHYSAWDQALGGAAPPDNPPLPPGSRLGPYAIESLLGYGGMGEVYKARDTRLGRFVAIKVLKERFATGLQQEARAISSLNHANICTLYDVGPNYLVMELLEGRTLASRIREGPISFDQSLQIARQIAGALEAAHLAGIVHRDLKPENILLKLDGTVKVLDFGLADIGSLCQQESPAPGSSTRPAGVMGTAAYMAPEQVRGKPVDHRADIWSLGVVLYEMLTGRRPFLGGNVSATLGSVLSDNPPQDGIPRKARMLLQRCLEKDPSRRPGDIRQVRRMLDAAQLSRSRRFRFALALTLLSLLAAVVISTPRGSRAGSPPRAAPLVRITADTGLTFTPALSPDGTLLAYASDREGAGNLEIWVQPVGGPATRLTRGSADNSFPDFSPDGQTIAFRSEQDGGGIYSISAHGGPVRRIASFGRRPRFSPDGKWIAYWIGTDTIDLNYNNFPLPGSAKIFIVPLAGGPPREVRSDFAAASYPVWMPDSKHLLFLGNRDPGLLVEPTGEPASRNVDWWVTPINGEPAIPTGANTAFRALGLSSISQVPEQWIDDRPGVLMSASLADTHNLWWVPISAKDWKIAGAPARMTFGTTMDIQPSVAAGNRVVFASLTGSLDVWSIAIGTDPAIPSTAPRRLTVDAFDHSYPSVSADGAKMAYSSRKSGARNVWVKDLATAHEAAVQAPRGSAFGSVLSSDGAKILYRVVDRQRSFAYLASLAGGASGLVAEDCSPGGWSSDQKQLLCVGAKPARISVVELASGRKTALLNHSSWTLWNPRFSPDDRWVSFNATAPGRSRIFVVKLHGKRPIPESDWIPITGGIWDDKPRWSQDSNTLYFMSQRDGYRCIWAQPLDMTKHPKGKAVPVFHSHQARRSLLNVSVGNLDMSVARDKIVFNMGEQTGNVWLTRFGSR